MSSEERSQAHFQTVIDDIERTRDIGERLPWFALIIAILWWGGSIGTLLALVGLENIISQTPLLVGAAGLVLIVPGFLIIAAGMMARSSRQSREANALVLNAATRLLLPGQVSRSEAETMADTTRRCASEINQAMGDALAALKNMSEALSSERLRVESVAYATADNARDLTERLGEERKSLEVIAQDLKSQIELMGEAIPRQARLMVEAAKVAKVEVGEADTALEARITKLQGASAGLVTRLESLNRIAEDAARRTQLVHQTVANVEDKLDKSNETVKRAQQASEMAVSAVRHVGEALEEAVSSALDGARYASSEITQRSEEARQAADLALSALRTAGRDTSQALRDLRADTSDSGAPPTNGMHISSTVTDDSDAIIDPPAPISSEEAGDVASAVFDLAGEALTLEPQPQADDIFEDEETHQTSIASEVDSPDGLFETDIDEIPPPAFLGDADDASFHPDPAPIIDAPAPDPFPSPTLAAADPVVARRTEPTPALGDTAWRDILADLDEETHPKRKPTASSSAPLGNPVGREETAEALIERLNTSGIPLAQTFRSKDKKKIAAAARKGEEARRMAIRAAAGREVDRVDVRLRKDKSLQDLAIAFRSAEEEDALRALEDTSKSGRSASSRLSAYLLIDAALA